MQEAMAGPHFLKNNGSEAVCILEMWEELSTPISFQFSIKLNWILIGECKTGETWAYVMLRIQPCPYNKYSYDLIFALTTQLSEWTMLYTLVALYCVSSLTVSLNIFIVASMEPAFSIIMPKIREWIWARELDYHFGKLLSHIFMFLWMH